MHIAALDDKFACDIQTSRFEFKSNINIDITFVGSHSAVIPNIRQFQTNAWPTMFMKSDSDGM